MNIANIDKAEILVALYNVAKIQGHGFMSHNPRYELTKEKAAQLLVKSADFDYLNGKVLKINLKGDELDTYLFNRDNGPNAAENALQALVDNLIAQQGYSNFFKPIGCEPPPGSYIDPQTNNTITL